MAEEDELLTLINRRISKVIDLIKEQNADGLLIFNQANYRYLTNFTGEEAPLKEIVFFFLIHALMIRLRRRLRAKLV